MQEILRDMGLILGWKDPLEEVMATHSSIVVLRIPWTEEPGGLRSQRVWHNWSNFARAHTHTHVQIYEHLFKENLGSNNRNHSGHSPAQAEWLLSGNTTRLSPWPCKPNPSLPQGQVQSTWTSIYTQNMWEKNFHIFLLSTFDQKSK